MEKFLLNIATCERSIMINLGKFLLELSHHGNRSELSSHYPQKPSDDRRYVRDFMEIDYFGGEVLLVHLFF